jgi:hypothetical protein
MVDFIANYYFSMPFISASLNFFKAASFDFVEKSK